MIDIQAGRRARTPYNVRLAIGDIDNPSLPTRITTTKDHADPPETTTKPDANQSEISSLITFRVRQWLQEVSITEVSDTK